MELSYVILITLPFSLIAFFGFLIPLFSEFYYAGLYDYEPDLVSGAMADWFSCVHHVLTIYWLATIVPHLAITVRRLHDPLATSHLFFWE